MMYFLSPVALFLTLNMHMLQIKHIICSQALVIELRKQLRRLFPKGVGMEALHEAISCSRVFSKAHLTGVSYNDERETRDTTSINLSLFSEKMMTECGDLSALLTTAYKERTVS